MEQHTYDNESVQELLDWAKKMVETNNYPTERFKINKCTSGNINCNDFQKLGKPDFSSYYRAIVGV